MNYNENSKPTLESTILNSIRGSLVDTHTTLIAKITKVNQKTIDCKPVISRLVNDKTVDLPVFIEVPIINFLGGSSSIQMPLAVGDYAVLFVVERCFDEWYSGNDFKPPLEARIHDYSDCIALVGLKNMQGELDIPTVITMLGDTYQEGNYEHLGNRTQTGDYDLKGNITHLGNKNQTGNFGLIGNMTITGTGGGSGTANMSNITINQTDGSHNFTNGSITITNGSITITGGNVTVTGGDVIADGISLKNHRHSGVQSGGSNTGIPN